MTTKEKNKLIYEVACEYLLSIVPESIEDIEKYLQNNNELVSLNQVYEILIQSAQEYQSLPNVIKFIERKEQIKEILYGYDIQKISELDFEALYYQFRETFDVKSKDSNMNLWYKWSRAVVDSASYLSQFKDIDDFKEYVNMFDNNTKTRIALPLVISTKIRGVGFALACNFLKELGYINYPKPDVHLKDICFGLNLCDKNQYEVFDTIIQIADDNSVSPYRVDKIFWLIGSGFFYDDNIRIGSHKVDFIEKVNEELNG
ncbi:hypothetical protein SAMN02910369_02540 [Lachnospiraceae bacterium NE2001]|nr:hypothetical protein SAMN02910369_02540 [Lachnospiraceae bacterium NE2001]